MEYFDIALQLVNEINEKYDKSYLDFQTTVGNLENSLKKIVPSLYFKIEVIKDGHAGTILSLTLDPNADDSEVARVKINDFFLPTNGYPIEFGRYSKQIDEFKANGVLNSLSDIENYFKELTTNSDSIIIQSVGYAARRLTRAANFKSN